MQISANLPMIISRLEKKMVLIFSITLVSTSNRVHLHTVTNFWTYPASNQAKWIKYFDHWAFFISIRGNYPGILIQQFFFSRKIIKHVCQKAWQINICENDWLDWINWQLNGFYEFSLNQRENNWKAKRQTSLDFVISPEKKECIFFNCTKYVIITFFLLGSFFVRHRRRRWICSNWIVWLDCFCLRAITAFKIHKNFIESFKCKTIYLVQRLYTQLKRNHSNANWM